MTTFSGPPLESEPYVGALTFGGFLDEVVAKFAEREAIVSSVVGQDRVSWSYAELRDRARAVTKALISAGVTRGTRVGLLAACRPEWVAALWGATMSGAVVVPFNTFAERPELEHMLRHSDVTILLTQPALLRHRYLDDFLDLCPDAGSAQPGALYSPSFPFLRRVVAFDVEAAPGGAIQDWNSFLAAGAGVPDNVVDGIVEQTVPTEDAIVIYTSGTTSLPKGALHLHRAAMLQSWRHGHREGLLPGDRLYSAFPLFWSTGITFVLGAVLSTGACLVTAPYFDPEDALRLIEQERVTIVQCWGHQTIALRGRQLYQTHDLSSVRRVGGAESALQLTGADPSPDVANRPDRQGYGMSEAFTYISSTPVNAPVAELGYNGRILAGNAVRVVKPDSGAALGEGQEGELIVKGPVLMRAYLKVAPEVTFDEEGYFHTGDSGWVDAQGLLRWTGRLTSLIKTAGANVSPLEVENALLTHPDIKGAAVVGSPDPVVGERVVACVVPREASTLTETQVRNFLRGSLSSYKIPSRVLFFGDNELPQTGSNKFDIGAIKKIVSRLLVDVPRNGD
jgi:acyl-CoA synthetase (AMP-forming)/AMP-acid ligase II